MFLGLRLLCGLVVRALGLLLLLLLICLLALLALGGLPLPLLQSCSRVLLLLLARRLLLVLELGGLLLLLAPASLLLLFLLLFLESCSLLLVLLLLLLEAFLLRLLGPLRLELGLFLCFADALLLLLNQAALELLDAGTCYCQKRRDIKVVSQFFFIYFTSRY